MTRIELGFYALGNGLSVANKSKEVSGDYEKVGHISDEGVFEFNRHFDKSKLEDEHRSQIEKQSSLRRVNAAFNLISGSSQNEKTWDAMSKNMRKLFTLLTKVASNVELTEDDMIELTNSSYLHHSYRRTKLGNPVIEVSYEQGGDRQYRDFFKDEILEINLPKKSVEWDAETSPY